MTIEMPAENVAEWSKFQKFMRLSRDERKARLSGISDEEAEALLYDWDWCGRPKQQPPKEAWLVWLILAGRGWGKTATGAQMVRKWVEQDGISRIALIGPTSADCRDVMLEGPAGLMRICPRWAQPTFEPSRKRLVWPNGAMATFYSAEEPERLRGPQHGAGWLDEMAAWSYLQETYDMYQFGLRLGKNPQTCITTTPKPLGLIRDLIAKSKQPSSGVTITVGTTYENRDNLAPTFFNQIAQYEGTKLGRQEIHAEVLDLEEGAIIKRSWFRMWPNDRPFPEFEFIIQSYDTAFTEKTNNDPTACSVWGVFRLPDGPYCVMLLDAWDDHMEYPDLREKVIDDFKEAKYGEPPHKADLVLIEDKGSGISLRQDIERANVPVRAYNPGRDDKVARLNVVSHVPKYGRIYIPESVQQKGKFRTWARAFVDQVCTFPEDPDAHDDYVDTFSQVLKFLLDDGWIVIDPQEIVMAWPDERRGKGNPYFQ